MLRSSLTPRENGVLTEERCSVYVWNERDQDSSTVRLMLPGYFYCLTNFFKLCVTELKKEIVIRPAKGNKDSVLKYCCPF